jgi:threonylcarbamoyladenosine tRNA methylthiotransferase MtaB
MNPDKRFFFQTFGCKVNQYESSWLSGRFCERGYIQADSVVSADVVVVHTCTVTSKSDSQCRQGVRKIIRENPQAEVLVTGCYARLRPKEFEALGGTVFRQNDFSDLLGYLDSAQTAPVELSPQQPLLSGPMARSRAFIKVQDGCNCRCSYCIVPQARGNSRSQSPQAIIEEIGGLEAAGYREVVLTGVHLGAYGKDLDSQTTLAELLGTLLGRFESLRFRLSSIEPDDIDEALLDILDSHRLCPHLHLPLQSASRRILKLMDRAYTPARYAALVEKIQAKNSNTAIGTDIMVGFPTETDDDFQQTKSFVDSVPFAYLHVFVYSARPDTPAASLDGQIGPNIKKERGRIIREISKQKRREFIEKNLGSIRLTVVLDKLSPDGSGQTGLTDNYIRVFFQEEEKLAEYTGKILPANLIQLNRDATGATAKILW